jgi:hypothetical protein
MDLHPLRAALDPCQQLVGAKREAMARSVSESNSVSETLHLILLLLGLGGPAGGALSAYGIARGMGRFARRSQPLAPEG